jgi:hypothetical protein
MRSRSWKYPSRRKFAPFFRTRAATRWVLYYFKLTVASFFWPLCRPMRIFGISLCIESAGLLRAIMCHFLRSINIIRVHFRVHFHKQRQLVCQGMIRSIIVERDRIHEQKVKLFIYQYDRSVLCPLTCQEQ